MPSGRRQNDTASRPAIRFAAWFAAGLCGAAIIGVPAIADDTEAYLGAAARCEAGAAAPLPQNAALFTTPVVAVEPLDRTRHLNDLFVSVFTPVPNRHWPGNLKKYRLRVADLTIVDANGRPALDARSGRIAVGAQSYWSETADPQTEAGGAANRIPPPPARRVYTHLRGHDADLTAAANAVSKANAAIDDALLNTGRPGGPTRDELIDFVRGYAPGGTAPRQQMGGAPHSQAAVLSYDAADPNATLIFHTTNDGYLHAIDANTGVEQWAFVPEEFLGSQRELYLNEAADAGHYGIDASPRLQVHSDDGVIDSAGEKAYLIFGMRRGGSVYYALDVSLRDRPRLLWRRGTAELASNGQSWSDPVPARIEIDSGRRQNPDRLVIVLGGGYDPAQDGDAEQVDTKGNAIYIVDTISGEILWHGSQRGADKNFAAMDSSFASAIKVVDLDDDGLADRMYAADLGGQIWRFDVDNGRPPAELVAGGVIARLGAAPRPSDPARPVGDGPDNRRFYYSPDVALASRDGHAFIHIGIGSGYRAHALSPVNHDRFYALRDHAAFAQLSDEQYAAIEPIVDSDLIDVTDNPAATVPAGGPGWRLELREPGWHGEKILAEARTFNNRLFFTSFAPGDAAAEPCSPPPSRNRLYIVDLFDGSPVMNLDGDSTPAEQGDRYLEFPGAMGSEVVFVFPSPDDPDHCAGDDCAPEPAACVGLICISTRFKNHPVRTFWRQVGVD